MIVMCKCGRVKVEYFSDFFKDSASVWAQAVDKDPSQPNAIAHGLCPECANKPGRDVIVARLERFSGGEDKTEGGA